MYIMGTLLRHGSAKQKQQYLPKIATGELRLQSFAVTEPTTGSDTTKLKTTAVRRGDRYIVNGQKVWTSRVQHSELMLLLARTTPLPDVKKKAEGLSVFLVDLRESMDRGITVRPIRNMPNHETNEVFFDNLEVPADNLLGEEGKGFRYILDGMNMSPSSLLPSALATVTGFWRKPRHTRARRLRPSYRSEPGVQFMRAYVNVEAANLMRWGRRTVRSWRTPAPRQTWPNCWLPMPLGSSQCMPSDPWGFGFAAEYDVDAVRETFVPDRPDLTNLILSYIAEHVLGLPRSY
jgi:acyl-CoA dehydrogenase